MFLSRQLHRIKWFFLNYRNISIKSKLQSTHFLGEITYDTDSLCTSNNVDFIKEEKFKSAYKKALDTKPWDGFSLQWRVYIVCWFANHVKDLEGDFVECGVNTGAYSRAIIDYIDFNSLNKTFFLLDTFNGLVPEQISEKEKNNGINKYLTSYRDVYVEVKKTFENFPVKIIKGPVPQTLTECDTKAIAYLSIDMNCVLPEIASIEYFWPKITSGGVVILDDYGFPNHIEQKLAFDQFAKAHDIEILCLPTGQGIIIKK